MLTCQALAGDGSKASCPYRNSSGIKKGSMLIIYVNASVAALSSQSICCLVSVDLSSWCVPISISPLTLKKRIEEDSKPSSDVIVKTWAESLDKRFQSVPRLIDWEL